MSASLSMVGSLVLVAGSAALTATLIAALKPVLRRYALARPNARSSHSTPTPQGAGIAIISIPVLLLVSIWVLGLTSDASWPIALACGLTLLAGTGVFDDIYSLPVAVRLLVQFLAAAIIVLSLPGDAQILPLLPAWLEAVGLILGLVWFVNLTNFMDGIDGITVVQMLCVATGIVLIASVVGTPAINAAVPVALALAGGLIGFAPYNRHVASVFMGDVGSLPIGALVGWMLILLAREGYVAAALLLPMYYLADSTTTLYRRWHRGERLHQAHRSHFYQLAVQHGFRVPEVTNRIFVLNVALILFAILSVELRSPVVDIAVLCAGAILTAALLRHFERGRDV
ncbi:MAG: MraY family glycosyltransferase [Hyphomicrobiaceae bacterium]